MSVDATEGSELEIASPDAVSADGLAGDRSSGRGVPRWIAVVSGLYFVLYVAWRVSSVGSPGTRALIDAIAFALPAFAAVGAAWLASRRCSGEPRIASAWRWITVGYVFLAGAFALSLGYQIVDGRVPFPSLADASLLFSYPFLLIGLMRFPRHSAPHAVKLRLSLDGGTLVLVGAVIVWFLVLGPTVTANGQNLLNGAVASGYPIGDLLLIFGLAYVISRAPVRLTRLPLVLLAVGALVAVVGQLGHGWLALHRQSSAHVVVDVFYMATWALYLLAAASQGAVRSRQPDDSFRDRPRTQLALRGRSILLPYMAPGMVFALLIYSQVRGSVFNRLSLAIGATLVGGLVLAREFLAQRDLRRAQEELSRQTLHDALTGLPNRVLVLDRAEQMLARAERQMETIAALFVDVDGFKRINDTFGHAAGDELIRVVADRLATVTRAMDTVGRLSGDEFVLLLAGVTPEASQLVAERVLDALRDPIYLGQSKAQAVTISASIGIAVGYHGSAHELLRDADLALYGAKAAGKDRFMLFEASLQAAASDRLVLASELREALKNEQFFLLYQPTFDLQTQRVTGVEALIRWRHPTRGILEPDQFISLAEENGMIVAVGRWVLEDACRQAAVWHVRDPLLGISVNVSARQLERDRFSGEVSEALAQNNLDPSTLTLEITEAELMRGVDGAAQRLDALKALGVRIAIDDFGTAYSSLAYLRRLHVDAIKIDRSFISGVSASEESVALIRTLVQLGRMLGVQTLGEGIEDQAQLQLLQREQCDLGQGFLFARPLEASAVESFLTSVRVAVGAGRPIA